MKNINYNLPDRKIIVGRVAYDRDIIFDYKKLQRSTSIKVSQIAILRALVKDLPIAYKIEHLTRGCYMVWEISIDGNSSRIAKGDYIAIASRLIHIIDAMPYDWREYLYQRDKILFWAMENTPESMEKVAAYVESHAKAVSLNGSRYLQYAEICDGLLCRATGTVYLDSKQCLKEFDVTLEFSKTTDIMPSYRITALFYTYAVHQSPTATANISRLNYAIQNKLNANSEKQDEFDLLTTILRVLPYAQVKKQTKNV